MAVPVFSDPYRPGAVIADKYRLVARIGSGAMGAVWHAVNLSTNGRVALKLIERPGAELRLRLLREARSCAAIQHKNVVQVHDAGETNDGDPFLVMELLRGDTLAAVLQARRRLPLQEAALIGRDIARGLTQAHACGVVHRDLKPANIILHNQPGEDAPVVKILDFGVCKTIELTDGLRTVAGNAVGSLMYMSPEQARGEPDVDHRADLWSLGVVLFEMLTGERPFTGDCAEVHHKVTNAPVPRASRRLRNMDPVMDELVAACLTRDRAQRIGSAAEVASRLEPFAVQALAAARRPLLSLMDRDGDEPLPQAAWTGGCPEPVISGTRQRLSGSVAGSSACDHGPAPAEVEAVTSLDIAIKKPVDRDAATLVMDSTRGEPRPAPARSSASAAPPGAGDANQGARRASRGPRDTVRMGPAADSMTDAARMVTQPVPPNMPVLLGPRSPRGRSRRRLFLLRSGLAIALIALAAASIAVLIHSLRARRPLPAPAGGAPVEAARPSVEPALPASLIVPEADSPAPAISQRPAGEEPAAEPTTKAADGSGPGPLTSAARPRATMTGVKRTSPIPGKPASPKSCKSTKFSALLCPR